MRSKQPKPPEPSLRNPKAEAHKSNIMTMMVSVRRSSSNNGHPTARVTLYAAILAVFALTAIYLSSDTSSSSSSSSLSISIESEEEVSPQKIMMKGTVMKKTASSASATNKAAAITSTEDYERDETGGDLMTITQGNVVYKTNQQLDYYHCGPLPNTQQPSSSSLLSELVLLHGAAFTKENWKTSGILDKLCDINNNEDGGNLSTSAWDLPVSANGEELMEAYRAMVDKGVLSGGAVTFVTPSASGKALTSLVSEKQQNDDSSELKSLVKGWISVASGSVLQTSDEALQTYLHESVPILAIHGDEDTMGKKVTERLVTLTKAKGIELEGRHPVYLDSPDEFVMEVLKFMEENEL